MTKAANRLAVLSLLLLFAQTAMADWGIFASYAIFDQGAGNNYYKGINAGDGSTPLLSNVYLGNLQSGSTLILKGGEIQTFKNSNNGNSNVCGGNIYYRVYRTGSTPGSFASVFLNYDVNGNYGDQSSGGSTNQQWEEFSQNIDLLSGLSLPGTYVVEVYFDAIGGQNGGCAETSFENNGGANYFAYFDYDMTDSFTDGNFSANPVWSGDTGNWIVVANSDVAAGATGSQTLRLNATGVSQVESMSTPYSDWQLNQEWSFWFGRRGQGLTNANRVYFWLYANEADLESSTVDGYRLLIGEDNSGATDKFRLQEVTDGIGTDIFVSTDGITNGRTDFGLAIKVTRNAAGDWEIFSSALPAANGDGPVASDYPIDLATISRGTVNHTTYTPSGTGYLGFSVFHTTGASALVAQEFDRIRVRGNSVVISGCTNSSACNYDPAATSDDGSCDFSCFGCTDPIATNYSAVATIDDASCTYCAATLTWDTTLPDPILIGSGISNQHMAVEQDCNFNVGIKAIERFVGDIIPVSNNIYETTTGESPTSGVDPTPDPGTARWNYLVSVNLGTYTFDEIGVFLDIDFDPAVAPGAVYTADISAFMISQSLGNTSFFQDSQNLGFAFWQTIGDPAILAFDPFATGVYDLRIRVNSPNGVELLNVPIQVQVNEEGCTDPYALNYNSNANVDDGSCVFPQIVITEIHYNPNDGAGFTDANYEFLEIYNAEAVSVDLSGWVFNLGITFTFPAATTIAPGEYIVIALNAATYSGNGYQVFQYTGGLSNSGETVQLSTPSSVIIDTVPYATSSPWPTAANGSGPSLELIDPALDNTQGANWVAQTINGTPGSGPAAISGCTDPSATNYDINATIEDGSCTYGPASIVITELHYNPCGDQGNDGDFEFLELFNASGATVDLSGWEILGFEFTFPALSSIAPGEYIVVVTNGGAVNYPGPYQVYELTATGAAMANTGEAIALLDDLGNYIDYVNYETSSPWPDGANGGCGSLEVIDPFGNNNDPNNWQSSYVFGGTPGAPNSQFFECPECGLPGAVSVDLINDDFEDGNLDGWVDANPGDWAALSGLPINGTFSLEHNLTGATGTSSISYDMECVLLDGTCTTWQFQFRNGPWDPDAGDRWLVYLIANESDFQSSTIDGYAVGLNYATNDDLLSLYYIEDGAVASTILQSNYDVQGFSLAGVQVTKDEAGNWMMALDVNGGFDNLFNVASTPGVDNNLNAGRYLGVRFDYATGGVSGSLTFDDISMTQCGAETTWYSVSSGNTSDAIWSTDDLAVVGQNLDFGRFKRLVVQDGHIVTIDGDVIADDFSTEPTGVLDGGAGTHQLILYGNLVNDGSISSGNVNLTFTGNTPQLVAGNNMQIRDITIDCGATVNLVTEVALFHILYANSGTLNSNGNLMLYQDGSVVSYVAPIGSGAVVNGDVVHIVYLQTATNPLGQGWGWIAPATTGLTFADWDDDMITTGMIGSDAPSTTFVNIQNYDETLPGTRSIGFTPETDISNPIDPNLGYWLYEFNNALSVDMTGPLRQGSILVDASHTNNEGDFSDGWNLLHNMYAAPVDIEALVSNSDLDGPGGVSPPLTYYVRSMSTNSYQVYQAITGTGTGSRYLAPFQPFFTNVQAAHWDLQFDEAVKDIDQAGLLIVREELLIPTIEFSFSDGLTFDRNYLTFTSTGANGMDLFDAPKMFDDQMTCVASLLAADGEELMIDSRYLPNNDEIEIPVYVRTLEGGSFTFQVESMEDIPANFCMYIENLLTGEITPVELGAGSTLQIDEAFEGVAFKLVARPVAMINEVAASCYGVTDGGVEVIALSEGDVNYTWYDEESNLLDSTTDENGTVIQDLAFGTYYLEMSGEGLVCGSTTIPVNIDQPEPETYELSSVFAICNTPASAELRIEPGQAEDYSYMLYDEDGSLILSETIVNGESLIEQLNAGSYTLEVISGCVTLSENINLNDPAAVNAAFDTDADSYTLSNGNAVVSFINLSENADGFSWSFGDGTFSSDISPVHIYNEAGIYPVELIAENSECSGSTSIEVEISSETVGLSELSEENNIWVITMNDMLEIHFDKVNRSDVQLMVYDATGRLIENKDINVNNGAVYRYDHTELSSGMYTLVILGEDLPLLKTGFVR